MEIVFYKMLLHCRYQFLLSGLILAVVSGEDNACFLERVKCSSQFIDRYGIDVYRFDVLTSLDFDKILTAIHSVRGFTEMCSAYNEMWTCFDTSACPQNKRYWYHRVTDNIDKLDFTEKCEPEEIDRGNRPTPTDDIRLCRPCRYGRLTYLRTFESCWEQPKVKAAQAQCQLDLTADSVELMTNYGNEAATADIDHEFIVLRKTTCTLIETYLGCIKTATEETCDSEAVDWEDDLMGRFTFQLRTYHLCFEGWEYIIAIIILVVVIVVIAADIIGILIYVGCQRYELSIRRPRMRGKHLQNLAMVVQKNRVVHTIGGGAKTIGRQAHHIGHNIGKVTKHAKQHAEVLGTNVGQNIGNVAGNVTNVVGEAKTKAQNILPQNLPIMSSTQKKPDAFAAGHTNIGAG